MKEILFSHFGPTIKSGVWNGSLQCSVQTMDQIHGTTVVEVFGQEVPPQADALITRVPGLRIAVKTADCIPLVLVEENLGIVSVVHAGWRGLTANIIPQTLAYFSKLGADLSKIKVAVGPSLGIECSEFSSPYEEIPVCFHWAIQGNLVDLNAIAKQQLLTAGIKDIEWLNICTRCDLAWPSWRRTHSKERLWTWVELV